MTVRLLQLALAFTVVFTVAAAEFPVSDAVLGNLPPGDRYGFVAASDGDGFLAVWVDRRGVESQVFAARITSGGQVLDPTGIPLPRPAGARPQVLWNGERYLVFVERSTGLAVIEVNRDGTVGTVRTLLTNVRYDSYRGASIVTNGSRIVMVYGDGDGFLGWPEKLRVGVFTMDATLIRELVVDEADPANRYRMSRLLPSIAVSHGQQGGQFAVAWNLYPADQQLHLTAVRLAADGTRIDAQPREIGSAGLESILASNGAGYVAISAFYSWGVSADLRTVTAPAQMGVSAPLVIERNGVATLFGLSLGSNPTLTAVELDAQGHVTGQQPLSVPSRGPLAVASNGSELAVLWLDETGHFTEPAPVVAAVFDESTLQQKTNAESLAQSASRQFEPAVAASEDGILVAWKEPDGVYAGRVLANGTRLDGRGIRLSEGTLDGPPEVLFDGQRYLVAFLDNKGYRNYDIVVRFISPADGLLANELRFPGGAEAALTKSDDAVLLVWRDDRALYGSRINFAMQLIDPPIEIAQGGMASPMAGWNGREFLVAWRTAHWDFDYTTYPSIAGVRMSASLTPMDSEPRVFAQVPDLEHRHASLAWSGSYWVFAFETSGLFFDRPHEVRLVAVDRAIRLGLEQVIPGTVIANGFGPELVTAGSRLWLAWKEDTGDRALRLLALKADSDPDPAQPPQRIAAATPLSSEWKERFGMAAQGSQVVLAYPRYAGADAGYVPRIYATITGATVGKRRAVR